MSVSLLQLIATDGHVYFWPQLRLNSPELDVNTVHLTKLNRIFVQNHLLRQKQPIIQIPT